MLLRKHGQYSLRGKLYNRKGMKFFAVDNEPLNSIYNLLLKKVDFYDSQLQELLDDRKIHLSWNSDLEEEAKKAIKKKYKFGGVRTFYREKDHRIKLAHIFDAGRNFGKDDLKVRSYRSLNPMNVFPFPSSRCFEFEILEGLETSSKDIAEDDTIQSCMLSYICNYINDEEVFKCFLKKSGIGQDVDIPEIKRLKDIKLKILPKNKLENPSETKNKKNESMNSNGDKKLKESEVICPKVNMKNALSNLSQLCEHLRDWRRNHPNSPALCGGTGSCGTPWIHFCFDINTNVSHLTNVRGDQYVADDFCGIWALNGDTKSNAIDELLYQYDSGLEFSEILIPSVTKKRKKNDKNGNFLYYVGKKPLLKMENDLTNVGGFYCYKK